MHCSIMLSVYRCHPPTVTVSIPDCSLPSVNSHAMFCDNDVMFAVTRATKCCLSAKQTRYSVQTARSPLHG